jgi:hypothetical protein
MVAGVVRLSASHFLPCGSYLSPTGSHILKVKIQRILSFCERRLIRRAELAFWLFLLHQGPGKRNWFHSWEFRTWYLGMNLHSKIVSPIFDKLHQFR